MNRWLEKLWQWVVGREEEPESLVGPLDPLGAPWQVVLGRWEPGLCLSSIGGPDFVDRQSPPERYEPVLDALRILEQLDPCGHGLSAADFAHMMWGRYYDNRFAPHRIGAWSGKAGQWLRQLEARGLLRSFEEQSNWRTRRWALTRKGRTTLRAHEGYVTPLQAYRDRLENAVIRHEQRYGYAVDRDEPYWLEGGDDGLDDDAVPPRPHHLAARPAQRGYALQRPHDPHPGCERPLRRLPPGW